MIIRILVILFENETSIIHLPSSSLLKHPFDIRKFVTFNLS